MKKSFLSVLLACCIILGTVSLSGCFSEWQGGQQNSVPQPTATQPDEEEDDYTELTADFEGKSEYYEPIDITVGYDNLESEDQRTCYNEIDNCVNSISDEEEKGVYPCKLIKLDGVVLTEAELRLVISAYKLDHPLVFWLTESFGYSNTTGLTALQLYSYEKPQTLDEKQKKLYGKINKFLDSVDNGLDEFDRELLSHDRVIKSCEYADSVKSTTDDYLAFTMYGVLVNGSAVCEGYAKCFEYFLARLGIESFTLTGMGSKELHMWNAVKVDGNWYYVDPSWDDSKDYSKYDYFNITTEQLLNDHTLSKLFDEYSSDEINGEGSGKAANFNILTPQCDSIENNYYVKKCPHFTDLYSYNDEDIVNALYQTANKGEGYFHIYIDPMYLEYNTAVDQLFSTGDQLFFSYIDSVNEMSPAYIIDRSNVYIVKKESLNVVTAKINY
ncbi:MAG: hypothetical protein IJV39_01845 [Ruminococcus sp.]|nr:hypothetical protein [Ruminococcus sp.]